MKYVSVSFTTFFLAVFSVFGQEENALYIEVQQAKKLNVNFENAVLKEAKTEAALLKSFVNPAEVFFFDNISVDVKNSEALNLIIPLKTGNMVLELVKVPEFFYNYEVVTSDGKKFPANKEIKHYRGVVKDEKNSIATVTFYGNEIIGIVGTDEGNFSMAKDKKSGKHLFYNDRNLEKKQEMICGNVDDASFSYDPAVLSMPRSDLTGGASAGQTRAANNKIVYFHIETEYDIYQARGSIPNVEAFIVSLFNSVCALYFNEGVVTDVSCIYIWVSNDPYTESNTLDLLHRFQAVRTSITGDLGILLTFRANGGGRAAGYTGLCNASTAQKLSVAMFDNYSLNIANDYNQRIKVVTHEFGHLLGSYHTHACKWNGNSTAIDGCAAPELGNCSQPVNPVGGGTIMSYCNHVDGIGVKFNLGFGPQPGNVIRNAVAAASCVQGCKTISFTNQTVSQVVDVFSCSNVNAQNVTVQNGGRLGLDAPTVNVQQPFTVQYGGGLILKER